MVAIFNGKLATVFIILFTNILRSFFSASMLPNKRAPGFFEIIFPKVTSLYTAKATITDRNKIFQANLNNSDDYEELDEIYFFENFRFKMFDEVIKI